jgi:hypothetical protein
VSPSRVGAVALACGTSLAFTRLHLSMLEHRPTRLMRAFNGTVSFGPALFQLWGCLVAYVSYRYLSVCHALSVFCSPLRNLPWLFFITPCPPGAGPSFISFTLKDLMRCGAVPRSRDSGFRRAVDWLARCPLSICFIYILSLRRLLQGDGKLVTLYVEA